MNELLWTHELTRVSWQILNVLQPAAGLPETQLYEALKANAGRTTLVETVTDLVAKGWVVRVDDQDTAPVLKRTDTGRVHYGRVQERGIQTQHKR